MHNYYLGAKDVDSAKMHADAARRLSVGEESVVHWHAHNDGQCDSRCVEYRITESDDIKI